MGAVATGVGVSGAFFDVYDVTDNCAQPKLLNGLSNLTLPANVLGHEGGWSPDGKTYWAAGVRAGALTAIDVTNPQFPRIVYTGTSVVNNHGFAFSADGNRMYLTTTKPGGIIIMDVSDIQKRALIPIPRQVGAVSWNADSIGQHAIAVTWGGKPYVIVADEYLNESVRIIDVSDETKPVVVNHLRLEIHLPENAAIRDQDIKDNGFFNYDAHYCSVDRRDDPTALACGFFQSGVRVFNVVNPLSVREIAYYNPPAQVGKENELPGSEHVNGVTAAYPTPNLDTDSCTSPPRFVGVDQLWVTCQDNGVQVLKFTNNVFKKITNSNDPRIEKRTMDD